MAEAEGTFSRGRLEAFSDGVIAVIITIMVLELKPPENGDPEEFLKLWPSFTIYVISFVYVAIYWINHHSLLAVMKRVDPGVIWANNLLLLFFVAHSVRHRLCRADLDAVSHLHLRRAAIRMRGGVHVAVRSEPRREPQQLGAAGGYKRQSQERRLRALRLYARDHRRTS